MNFAELKQLSSLIKASGKEVRKVTSLTGCSMFTALNTVISTFRIQVSNVLEIGFSSITVGVAAMYYGPVLCGTMGVVADTLKYIVRPTGFYFPGFAVNEFLTGFIYGCFFYKKEPSLKRVILARLVVVLLVNMLLNPLWLSMMYGKAFLVLLTARIIKNIVLFPVDVALLYFALKGARRIKNFN